MATTKIVQDEDVWNVLGPYLFPAGIPPDRNIPEEYRGTQFIGGYPDEHRNPTEHGSQYLELIWYHDFNEEEHNAWDRLIKRARRRAENDDEEDKQRIPHIQVLKQWRNRTPGNETQAQMIAVLDAMVELWRLELKEE